MLPSVIATAQSVMDAPIPTIAPTNTSSAATTSRTRYSLGDYGIEVHAAAGIPHPLTGGFGIKYRRTAYLGGDLGAYTLKKKINGTDGKVKIANKDVRVKWYPFNGAFFGGLIYGRQTIDIEGTRPSKLEYAGTKLDLNLTATTTINSSYVTPHIGWDCQWDSGFVMGFDLGWQFSFGATAESDAGIGDPMVDEAVKKTESYRSLHDDVDSFARLVGNTDLLHVTILRLGWIF